MAATSVSENQKLLVVDESHSQRCITQYTSTDKKTRTFWWVMEFPKDDYLSTGKKEDHRSYQLPRWIRFA